MARKKRAAAPAKKKPIARKKAAPSRVRAGDEDIFIPGARRAVERRAPLGDRGVDTRKRLNDAIGDDGAFPPDEDAIYVPRPGAPIVVQTDWTRGAPADDQDAATPLGISNAEWFTGLDASAGTPNGWTRGALAAFALEINRRGVVVCRYGCNGTTANVVGAAFHAYDCPYWSREGKAAAPF